MNAHSPLEAGIGLATASLELKGVGKSFGSVEVLRDIDLSIAKGEFVVFVGPSGCGKSTLLRLIAGLEEVSEGEIAIGGKDVTDLDPSRRGIAMVFQSYALYPHMSVAQNMGFGLKMAHRPAAEVEQKVRAAAEILQLTKLLDRRPGQLSGGQRQRVAIGRAIVRDPQIFLFDEPLSNLDAELRVEMRIEIARLHKTLGNTMVYVTHDQTEAMTLADKIVVLRGGRIEQVGAPATLYEDPDNLFVAGFVGSPKMNVLPATLSESGLVVAGRSLPRPTLFGTGGEGGDIQLGIRPEHLRPARGSEPSLPFTVDFTEYLGGSSFLYGRCGEGLSLVVQGERGMAPKAGAEMGITCDTADMRLFDKAGKRLR
ncbi:ABC transporter ATP-binding protein [Aureimonas sp. AU40]|uniref:ABC transporter ATP-binding protein n=1 Tax=Aureimonas sp. AU40 TaxID=1637747 RepID=UPI0007824C62|nr:ABC transporter ATP-binding protein [Aureimonas sp. AU40]